MLLSSFKRYSGSLINKTVVHSINGVDWLGINNAGKGILMTTGDGASPTPPDDLLLAYGSCSASGVKFLLEKRGKKVRNVKVEIEGEWQLAPVRKIKEVRMNYIIDADDVSQELADNTLKSVEQNMCIIGQTMKYTPTITLVD